LVSEDSDGAWRKLKSLTVQLRGKEQGRANTDDGRTRGDRLADIMRESIEMPDENALALGVTVWENAVALRKLPSDLFRGDMDAWWETDGNGKQMACGWYDDGWPNARPSTIAMEAWSREFHRGQGVRDPKPWKHPDDYATQMYIAEYKSITSPHERREFLRHLHKAEVWMAPEFLDLIYADESTYVRAWAAGHLNTQFVDGRNYEPDLLQDPEPVVRAALWSNPQCQNLPWKDRRTGLSEGWKEQLGTMSQIERLGLMRNPKLEMRFVVALLETSSEQLEMNEYEHEKVLCAAAVNPDLIWGSRSAFEEYGTMWTLCLDKWIDTTVPEHFFKHIQTTSEIKKAIYQRLLEKEDDHHFKELRMYVIRSCDPLIDEPVLKKAWNDPDQECREIAKEQIGIFGDFVGVEVKKRR
jgi:hypothetical protein